MGDCVHGVDIAISHCGWCDLGTQVHNHGMRMPQRIYEQAVAMRIANGQEINKGNLDLIYRAAHAAARIWDGKQFTPSKICVQPPDDTPNPPSVAELALPTGVQPSA